MAAAWVWVLAYVLAFCVFQVLLYRYLQRDDTGVERTTPEYSEGPKAGATPHGPTPSTEDGIRCQHCGARNENEQLYSYCRECAQPIQGTT